MRCVLRLFVFVKEPTTTEKGLKERTCACGEKETQTIAVELPGSGDLKYTLNEDGESYSVIGISAFPDSCVVIPRKYNGLPVTHIGDYAFALCGALWSITFEGIIAQWDAISKGVAWNNWSATEVICSNGTVTLS